MGGYVLRLTFSPHRDCKSGPNGVFPSQPQVLPRFALLAKNCQVSTNNSDLLNEPKTKTPTQNKCLGRTDHLLDVVRKLEQLECFYGGVAVGASSLCCRDRGSVRRRLCRGRNGSRLKKGQKKQSEIATRQRGTQALVVRTSPRGETCLIHGRPLVVRDDTAGRLTGR